jgi:predicted phosphodiesterase
VLRVCPLSVNRKTNEIVPVKILHVADFHFRLDWFAWLTSQAANYDAIAMAGDLLNQFDKTPAQVEQWSALLAEFPCSPKRPLLVCSGNHDVLPDLRTGTQTRSGAWLRDLSRPGLIVDEQIWPGTPSIGVVPWCGRAAVPWTWPKSADIVVVHAPPAGTALAVSPNSLRDDGDSEVSYAIWINNPRLVLSGHVHEPRKWYAHIADSLCLNPGCDLTAKIPQHIIIDTNAGRAEWHCPDGNRTESAYFKPINHKD